MSYREPDHSVAKLPWLGQGKGGGGKNFGCHPSIEPSEGFSAQQKRMPPKLPQKRVSPRVSP